MRKLVHHNTVFSGFIFLMMLGWGVSLAAQSSPIGISISNESITEKDTFVVALSADSILTGRSVYAYRFYLTYSPAYFEFLGLEGIGSLLTGWGNPEMNGTNAGTLILAGAGTEPLTGQGEMIYLKFRSLRSGNTYIYFDGTESYLNERNPASIYTNGLISAAARSYPNIYPDQQQMFIGDEVQMSVSGGLEPYEYAVEDPQVAVITDVDKVRATGPGKTRVMVTDANEEVSFTTGLFDVRAIKMDLEEGSFWPADTFYIPVRIEISPGTTVYSGRFDLSYSGGITGLEGDIIFGDFPLLIENNVKSNRLTVSFASTSGISSDGLLCYLAFRANASGNQSVRFENMRFNESLLAWTIKSTYYINVNSLPTLNISPLSGTLMWGDVLKINVSNGTAPYTYSVSNPSLASIDVQGNLTAITGGQVSITATDANGATRTSGIFTITDNKITVTPTDGVLDNETRVPILSSPLPSGKRIFGFKANVTFDAAHLDFVRVDPPGGGAIMQASLAGNTIQIAGASGEGISSGIIGYMVFQIKNTLPLDGTADISLTSFSANENTLHSLLVNGNIHRVEQVSYRPIANAGDDFSLQEGSTGHLDGTGSYDLDGGAISYLWHAPEGFILNDSTSVSPEFTAPYVTEDRVFTITLVVNDGSDDSDPSQVNVTVLQLNYMPEANAGADLNYIEGSSVSLDGSNSFDPDGDAISFSWSSLDGIVLFNAASPAPSFILPQVSENTSYRFTLIVNDGALNSIIDTVSITAIQVNKKPVAFAGADFTIDEKEEWTLDGSLSYDADNDPISYLWTAPPGIVLSSSTVANPIFTAPAVFHDSVLNFTLIVNDGSKDSDPDVVRATIINLDSLSRENFIDSVFMTALDSFAIDTANAIVTLYVPYGLDIRALSPGYTLSKSASINPGSGTTHDFSAPVYYTVSAEDGFSNRLWKVELFRPEKTVQRQLNSGWNWISLNVQPQEMDISTLFSSLTLTDLDYLKSAEFSSIYYGATGWFGNLGDFPQNRMVKFKKSIAENLEIQGLELNPAITPIPIVKGWNNIAYLLNSDEDIGKVIENSSIPSGDVVLKGISASSVYYEGTGWVGDLDSLKVLHGYKINVQNSGNLMYNSSGGSKKSVSSEINDHKSLLLDHKVYPENFEYSATLIAEIRSEDGERLIGRGDLITAWHGNEIRGVSRARYISSLDKDLFILTYFSNEEDQDITFKILSHSDETEYETDLILNFLSDNITGEPYNPYIIFMNDRALKLEDIKGDKLSIYPNPVADKLTISSSTPLININLYTLTGKKILGGISAENSVTIPMKHFAPGIYTLEAETANEVIIRKIIKTSY